jgi:hypothetical protein
MLSAVRPSGTMKPPLASAIQSARFRTAGCATVEFAVNTAAANIRIVIGAIIDEQRKQMSYKSATLL